MIQFEEQITVLRPAAATNSRGDLVVDHGDPTEIPGPAWGVHIQPLSQNESHDQRRSTAVTAARLYTAAGVDLDVLHTDRIRWNGDTWFVDGDVARWPDPDGPGVHHVELTIRIVRDFRPPHGGNP